MVMKFGKKVGKYIRNIYLNLYYAPIVLRHGFNFYSLKIRFYTQTSYLKTLLNLAAGLREKLITAQSSLGAHFKAETLSFHLSTQ